MQPENGSPADWIRRAKGDLALARLPITGDLVLEDLCFHAQQAAEKSIKAVLTAAGISFPKTHNLYALFDLLPEGTQLPHEDARVARLTEYAVAARYPGTDEPLTEEERNEAVHLAESVLRWAEDILNRAGAF